MKVRRTRTLSSRRLSDISALLGGGKRQGTKTVARLGLVIKFSVHLKASNIMKRKIRNGMFRVSPVEYWLENIQLLMQLFAENGHNNLFFYRLCKSHHYYIGLLSDNTCGTAVS